MKVTQIKMKPNCEYSGNVQDIDSIDYIEETGTYGEKAEIYDYLKNIPKSIAVNILPYPYFISALSVTGEKYVCSVAGDTIMDNLVRIHHE